MEEQVLTDCEAAIGYRFQSKELLRTALTHSSRKPDVKTSNERLEFLGDAIVGLVISEHLFNLFPNFTEGQLTRLKSVLVSRVVLARVSNKLRLGEFMFLGKSITRDKKIPPSLLANVYEAIVGAIYVDGGIEPAREFILKTLKDEIDRAMLDKHAKNYKSLLQDYAQRELKATPTYELVSERGPDHIKSFFVTALIGKKRYGSAWGRSKKEAEQLAAKKTLEMLGLE